MRKKSIFILTLTLCCLLGGCAAPATETRSEMPIEDSIDMVGLYCFEFIPDAAAFWKSCGITTLQYWVREMQYADDLQALQNYLEKFERDIRLAKEMGFQVYIGLSSNFRVPEEGENWYTACFDPRDEQQMQKRLTVLSQTVKACKQADGFTIFCADPGGFVNMPTVQAGATTFIDLCKKFVQVIRAELPDKPVNINPWAISNFKTPILSPASMDFWLQETELTKQLPADSELVGANVGIEFACHDYYRGLALRQYAPRYRRDEFPLYPLKEDLEELYQRDCERRWAWPYFLLDECDNGDGAGEGVQLETRYIKDLVTKLKQIDINGIIGNWAAAGKYTRALNMYAFGRFCQDSTLTEEQVIREYAAKNVAPESVDALTKALIYIENNSHWHQTMPIKARLKPLETVSSAQEALQLIENVIVLEEAEGVAEAPASYVARVRDRLQALAEKE